MAFGAFFLPFREYPYPYEPFVHAFESYNPTFCFMPQHKIPVAPTTLILQNQPTMQTVTGHELWET
jgi:hypothetical protein